MKTGSICVVFCAGSLPASAQNNHLSTVSVSIDLSAVMSERRN